MQVSYLTRVKTVKVYLSISYLEIDYHSQRIVQMNCKLCSIERFVLTLYNPPCFVAHKASINSLTFFYTNQLISLMTYSPLESQATQW